MVEINHNSEPEPVAAKPILASYLLDIEEKQRKRFAKFGETIRTGCSEIDEYVLRGGLERGIIVGISGEGKEGRLISLNLLASMLLSHSSSPTPRITKASIIDTTGSFPLPLLASILKARVKLERESKLRKRADTGNYESPKTPHTEEDSKQIQKCLEMVAISRVFDLEGLWEVLGEVGHHSMIEISKDTTKTGAVGDGAGLHEFSQHMQQVDFQRGDLTSCEGDFDASVIGPQAETNPAPRDDSLSNQEDVDSGTEIIIIDNMTHIINELFVRKEKNEAHALLSTLSHVLHTLSQTSNILTILHNGTTSVKASYPNELNPNRQPQTPQQAQTSIFAGNPLKPALGRIFDQFPTLHLLLSPMPKTRFDAESLYDQDEASPFSSHDVQYCTVLEVLKDETPNLGIRKGMGFGRREQRWTALEESLGGLGLVPAFEEKGTMRGLGLERERISGQGGVAKIYGFGGRRG